MPADVIVPAGVIEDYWSIFALVNGIAQNLCDTLLVAGIMANCCVLPPS
jgi:hypothetical protein